MRSLVLVKLLLGIVLGVLVVNTNRVYATESDDADGFDDVGEATTLTKRMTDLSASNLNPFQVEVFVSYCVA